MKCPKLFTYRSKKYLEWIRGKPCEVCGGKAEAHHVRRLRWGAGTSTKPHDYVCVSRCREHHNPEYEYQIEFEIIDNLMAYIDKEGLR